MMRTLVHQSVAACHGVPCGLPAARPMQGRVISRSERRRLDNLPEAGVPHGLRGARPIKSPARFPAGSSSRLRHSRSSIVASGLFSPRRSSAGKLFDPAHVPPDALASRFHVSGPVLHLKASPVVSARHHRSEPRCWIIHPRNRGSRP